VAQVDCGRPSVYADDFATQKPFWQLVASTGAQASVASGVLQLSPAASAASSTQAAAISKHAVNLDEDVLSVHVLEVPNDASAGASFAARHDDANSLSFSKSGAQLQFLSQVAGATTGPSVTFDASTHRHWRFRETSGTLYWETSPDGKSWTEQRQLQTPDFARVVNVVLSSRAAPAVASPGLARFDDLNAGRSAKWCASSSLSDDFADGTQAIDWAASLAQGACTKSETGGNAQFSLLGTGQSSCFYQTATAFDLRGDSVYIHIPAITKFYQPVRAFLLVANDLGQRAEFGFVGSNQLYYQVFDGTTMTSTGTLLYTPSAEGYWRIREQGGTFFLETSSDGQTWGERAQATAFQADAVHVRFGVSTNAAMGGPIGIGVPGYNTP